MRPRTFNSRAIAFVAVEISSRTFCDNENVGITQALSPL
jgi:hypothetical protein